MTPAIPSIRGAAAQGVRAVRGAPGILLALWLSNLSFALPFAVQIALSLRSAIGPSLVHEKLRRGFDMGWFGEYRAAARGIETSFGPAVTGDAAIYGNLEDWLTGRLFVEQPGLVAAGALYALLWIFLIGGVLDRFARPVESVVRSRFTQACGLYFFRLVRLALIGGALYGSVYLLSRWLLGRVDDWTRDATGEWSVLWASLAVYAPTALLLLTVNLILGYAKIATVVENRRAVLLAVLRGARFVLAYPGRTVGLYLGMLAVAGVLLALYAWIAPGPLQSSPIAIAWAFVLGQAYLAAGLIVRLTLLGAQTALFQALAPR
jgi:hypothetical protein